MEVPLVPQESLLQKLGLQTEKPCTRMQMKHERFGSADVSSLDGCEIL